MDEQDQTSKVVSLMFDCIHWQDDEVESILAATELTEEDKEWIRQHRLYWRKRYEKE